MPDMGTIATVLTVNAAPAQKGFSVYKAELASVRVETERAGRAAGRSSGGAAFAMLELGRAAEDAAVGFGTGGLTGAIRGSMNNLTTMATMMGGPMVGAIAGVTAAGVSLIANYFMRQPKAADDATAALKRHTDAIREMHEERRRVAEFKDKLPGMEPGDALKEGRGRQQRIDELRDLLAANQRAREQLAAPARPQVNMMAARAQMFGIRAFNQPGGELDEAAQAAVVAHHREANKLLKERLTMERELAQLQRQAKEAQDKIEAENRRGMFLAVKEFQKQEAEERKRRFFAQPAFWNDIDLNLQQREGRGLPGFGAPQRGTVAAQSAILRAGQNRDKGVSEQQLAKLKDIDRKLNDFLKKNALGLGVIALP